MTTDLTKVNIPAFPKNTKDQVAVKTWKDEFIATCGLLNCRDVIKTGKVAAYSKDIVKETDPGIKKELKDCTKHIGSRLFLCQTKGGAWYGESYIDWSNGKYFKYWCTS